jgi:hypothetical protein
VQVRGASIGSRTGFHGGSIVCAAASSAEQLLNRSVGLWCRCSQETPCGGLGARRRVSPGLDSERSASTASPGPLEPQPAWSERPFLGRPTPVAPTNQLPSSRSAPEGGGLPVLLHHRVPRGRQRRGTSRSRRGRPSPQRPVEPGVPEAEHPAVTGHQPVASAVGGGSHTHDGPV